MRAWVLHDREHLYLRVVCDAIPAGRIRGSGTFTPARGGTREQCYGTKSIAFIAPEHGRQPWYRFDLNAAGLCYGSAGPDRTWNSRPAWRIKSEAHGNQWHLTAAFPFAALGGVAEQGQVWGFKLIMRAAKNDNYIWPPVAPAGEDRYCAPDPSDPAYYGRRQAGCAVGLGRPGAG